MKVVGELFATGEMQLPFVLQSAETMKAAVAYLTPHMDRLEGETSKGRIVLATVKGDVHDIGKNLVDIILTNNGYEVHNLGIKCPIGDMVARAEAIKADAIGMSGLLVKSTLIMRDNLEELNSGGLAHYPVLLGGAALTRSYVERDLREVYEGRLFYGRDAFEGLRTMERLMELKRTGDEDPDFGRAPTGRVLPERRSTKDDAAVALPTRSPEVAIDNPIPQPPFLGARVVKGVAIDEIAAFVNETALVPQPVAVPSRVRRDRRRLQGAPPADASGPARGGEDVRRARTAGRVRVLRREWGWRRAGPLDGREPDSRVDSRYDFPRQHVEPVPLHRGLLPAGRVRRGRLRRVPHRHDGKRRVGRDGRAVQREPLSGLPPAARSGRRDG